MNTERTNNQRTANVGAQAGINGTSAFLNSGKQLNSSAPVLRQKASSDNAPLLRQCEPDRKPEIAAASITRSKPAFIESLMQSLLELAIYFQVNQCALFLLEHGASVLVSSNDKSGEARPLEMALKKGNLELLDGIFKNTNENDFDNAIIKILDKNKNKEYLIAMVGKILSQPVFYESKQIFFKALKAALEKKDHNLVSRFLSFKRLSDTELLQSLTRDEKDALLFLALTKKNQEVAGSLVEAGVSLFSKNSDGKTALELLVDTMQEEAMVQLINAAILKGENKSKIIEKTLIHAIQKRKLILAESILQGVDLTELTIRKKNALASIYYKKPKVLDNAIKRGHSVLATALINSSFQFEESKNKITPQIPRLLTLALENRNSSVAEALISSIKGFAKDQLNVLYGNRDSLLMHAIRHDQTKAAKLLIDARIEISIENKLHETALSIAIEQKNVEIASLLMEKEDEQKKIKSDVKYASTLLTKAINSDLTLSEKLLQCIYEGVSPSESTSIDSKSSSNDNVSGDVASEAITNKSVSQITAAALEAAKPSAREVYFLFKSTLVPVMEEEKGSNAATGNKTVALELARYLRTYHKQFLTDSLDDLEEELKASSEPAFASYLKQVERFIVRREAAASLVSQLRMLLYPADQTIAA